MRTRERRTFQQILQQEQPRIARELELKARIASKVAKVQPRSASILYQLKNRALRQLFSLPGHMPLVRDAWTTNCGILLSIKLYRTDSWLHFPFEQLSVAAQRFYGPWVIKRAHGNRWQLVSTTHNFRTGSGR